MGLYGFALADAYGAPGVQGGQWLPPGLDSYGVTPYYARWQYSLVVDTVRTISVGDSGATIADSQVTRRITLIISEPFAGWTYNVEGGGAWSAVPPGAEYPGEYALPSSLTYSYTQAGFDAAGGEGFPQGDAALYNVGFFVNSVNPNVTIDLDNSFTPNTGPSMLKLIGSQLLPVINNNGDLIDFQTVAGINRLQVPGAEVQGSYNTSTVVGKYGYDGPGGVIEGIYTYAPTLWPGDDGQPVETYYAGISTGDAGTFGLALNSPSVPMGSLVCTSSPAGAFPALPKLTAAAGSGVVYSSALADVSNWGGFRFLKLTARVNGFSGALPLPKILLGVVPTTKLSTDLCSSALEGSPSYGIWYEVAVTEQGTAGQTLTVDIAHPVQGSGKWWTTSGGAGDIDLPDPLGVGVFRVNPCAGAPGEEWTAGDDGVTANYGVLDTATLVVTVDVSEAKILSTANITLSNFQLIEVQEGRLSINLLSYDNLPVVPNNQPATVEASTASNGTLISVVRDGKAAVSIRTVPPSVTEADDVPVYQNPLPGVAFMDGDNSVWDWQLMLAALSAIGNGYSWVWNPLYTNVPDDTAEPTAFLPVPSQFTAKVIKLGGSLTVPIAARCTTYSNSCPWANVGVISGDDYLLSDTAEVGLIALSDSLVGTWTAPVTVQSAKLVGGVPTATDDFGPTALSPDSVGFIRMTGPVPTQSGVDESVENEIDGVFVSFDEGLARGQSVASGRLITAYVPIRAGESLPIATAFPPSLSRRTLGAFCLRSLIDESAAYSDPRNAIWLLGTDSTGRLQATLCNGYSPFAVSSVVYPTRGGASIQAAFPQPAVNESELLAVYRRSDNKWVVAVSTDQYNTLGAETVLFNNSGGLVTCAYDKATGGQYYCMSLRNDGLDYMSAPAPSTDPGALPQVAVIRRRDSAGNSLPFVTASTATISGTVWENVVYLNQPSGGAISIMVFDPNTIVLVCGVNKYSSTDNGSNFYDQNGDLVASLTNMASPPSGATGGTQNPS